MPVPMKTAAARAEGAFGEAGARDVVVDLDGHAEACRELGGDGDVAPAEVPGEVHDACGGVDDARYRDADRADGDAVRRRVVEEGLADAFDLVDDRAAVGLRASARGVGERPLEDLEVDDLSGVPEGAEQLAADARAADVEGDERVGAHSPCHAGLWAYTSR